MNNPLTSIRQLGRPFLTLWVAETISMAGSSLTGFALGVWIFQQSGKALDYASMSVVLLLPRLLIAPWAGSLADRVDRRYIVVAADAVAAVATCVLGWLLWSDTLAIWHLYAIGCVGSIAGAFQAPAYQALSASILPKEHMPRASGLMGVTGNVVRIVSPLVAGALMGYAGLPTIIAIDLTTFCIGTALVLRLFSSLAALRIKAAPAQGSFLGSSLRQFFEAMIFFRQQRLMLGLLFYFTLQSSLMGLVGMLIAPLVLSSHPAETLGLVMTIAGVGSLIGSGYLVVGEVGERLMIGLLVSDVLVSACVLLAGLNDSVFIYLASSFVAAGAGAMAGACGGALWMRKVPVAQQGRIFALTGMGVMLAGPAVALAGGFLADRVLGPALAPGGSLAGNVGLLIGTGKGRGLALVFVICGGASLLVSLAALMHQRFRSLDRLVPDGR